MQSRILSIQDNKTIKHRSRYKIFTVLDNFTFSELYRTKNA